ncbi:DUF4232 domain-containing protein [Streptomyces sp. NPDC059787]|uniref:DUF4232 domain-containing protein n=1 Tax=Streptomyces sp. NPDC059787 TaxID=3346947 RepID=UPI00364B5802
MRSSSLPLVLVLVGVLSVTACGTHAESTASGASCTGRPSGTDTELERGGVRVTGFEDGSGGCVLFEVTHAEAEPFTYTVTFDLLSESGRVLYSAEETVEDVAPGRTAVGRVALSGSMAGPREVSRVRIAEVRSVPVDEAPSPGGPCPDSGVRVYADEANAAMGLRVVSVRLENCGTRPYPLHGYPDVRLLDEDHEPVDGVRILHDGGSVAGGTGADGPALPLVLKPGEGAWAGLVWRNTVEAGTPVDVPYVRVRAKSGADPVTVVPELDLGTTGKLGVGPWKKQEE